MDINNIERLTRLLHIRGNISLLIDEIDDSNDSKIRISINGIKANDAAIEYIQARSELRNLFKNSIEEIDKEIETL